MFNKQEIKQSLEESICEVIFRKVTNQRYRRMYCTLDPKEIPNVESQRLKISEEVTLRINPELIVVWDVVKNDWRSFYPVTVERLETNQEKFQ
tara:strand:- start:417 stop:695 length:279 start_codon:yes stop_codon:yes gene_type:complete